MQPESLHKITVKKGGKIRTDIQTERIKYLTEQIAYWRKANQIHHWFVENVQDGADDCKEYDVSREQLQELVDTCKQVIAASKLVDGIVVNGYTFENGQRKPMTEQGKVIEDHTVAENLLPTQQGFFFGSSEYDEYYLNDVQDTIDMLEPLLKENGDGNFYYQSSW